MAIAPNQTISQLRQGVRLGQINVRVIHKWTRPEIRDKTKPNAIELLLLDAENDIIQATIRKPLISRLSSTLALGEIFNIRNLTVVNNTGLDRATPNPVRLQFEFSSRVSHVTNDVSIPLHGYRFAKFEDIINGIVPTTHYIDVVGKLFEIGPITETRHGHKCRTIKLEDIDGNQLCCTLWEPHTLQLPTLISEQPNPEQSKIIVIQCVETRKYEGQWRVQTTYNATVYQVNPDIPEVNAFVSSLSTPAPSNSLQIIDIPDDDDDDDVLTRDNIKTISDIKQNEKSGSYYTLAKIIDLDCTVGWYYDSCKACWTKTSKNDKGRWICARDGCDGNTSGFTSRVPRFQVKFLVTDASNEEAHFVVFDSQITQFINYSAAYLIAKLEKAGEQDSIPIELETFIDRQFVFKIEIHEKFNVRQSSNSYTVLNMSDDNDMAHKWIAKYTEMFKEEYDSFKSSTKELMVRAENAKLNKVANRMMNSDVADKHLYDNDEHSYQGEESETADTSLKITPLKRSVSRIVSESESTEQMENDRVIGDASSATKKAVIVKQEK